MVHTAPSEPVAKIQNTATTEQAKSGGALMVWPTVSLRRGGGVITVL